MPIDYDGANAGVFTRVGKLVKHINSHLADATTTFPAELKAIADPYEAADLTLQIDGLYGFYEGLKAGTISLRQGLAAFVDRTLLDRDTVLEQLGVLNASISDVLTALHNQMLLDSKTINRSTVTLGSVTAVAGNQGNGTALVTKVLDGFNPPLQGGLAHLKYNGLNSELGVTSETMTLTCTADSNRDGTAEGSEQFAWNGGVSIQPLDWQTEGSGQGPTLTVANGSRLVTDGDFENWTNTNTPSNWTIDNGTAGTHIFQENGAANLHRGLASLRFAGTGAQATIRVSQTVSPSTLRARRMYNLSVRIKASSVPAAGQITIQFEGTGYTASSSEKIDLAAGSFPTAAFTAAGSLFNFFISTPAIIPSDWKLVVQITGTLSSGVNVYFDSLALKEVEYHGGVGAVLVAGSTRWVAGDKLTFTVSNDNAGVFQTFFRRWFKFQLPSSATPNIADSLAT